MNTPESAVPADEKGRRVLHDELGDLLQLICETPAPTFHEDARGRLLSDLMMQTGLAPLRDRVGNVVAEVPGGQGPRVLLAAHLDTVFAAEVDVTVTKDGHRWRAPGIGDNSASLAVLVYLLRRLQEAVEGTSSRSPAPPDSLPEELPRLTVAATVGEEGLGDLRGIRALLEHEPHRFDAVVAVDGHLGTIVDRAVGSKRYEIGISAAGGHSWGDFPAPSATHALGAMVHSIAGLKPNREPRSSFNVGQVWGGTGVNAIAQEAGFNLDLRSEDATSLAELEREALGRLRRVAKRYRVTSSVRQVGDRPAASPTGRELTGLAREALAEVGVAARAVASSTDANVAMALGVPSIAFGVYTGGDAHRMSEWLERPSLGVGFRALVGLLNRLATSGIGQAR